MARVRWSTATLPSYVSSMWSNTEDWQYIRKAPELVAMFNQIGGMWVDDLNRELRDAQAARKQKIEDGYKFALNVDSDRIRMRIWAFTARAMVHEAKHQSILKLMKHSGWDVNQTGRAEWDWGTRKRKRRAGGRGRKHTGSTGSGRTRPPGGSGSGSGSGTSSSSSESTSSSSSRPGPSRPAMDPRREASYRRQLITLDILSQKGATESERNNAAEKARRIRERLGE